MKNSSQRDFIKFNINFFHNYKRINENSSKITKLKQKGKETESKKKAEKNAK